MLRTALLLIAPLVAFETHPPLPGTVGLLTPPFAALGPEPCVHPVGELDVFDGPSADALRRGQIVFVRGAAPCEPSSMRFDGHDVPARESGYEEAALVVLESRDGWRRVAVGEGDSAWVHPPSDWRFDTLRELLVDSMAAFTSSWDGRVCTAPDAGCASPALAAEAAVRVIESSNITGATWWRVEVTTPQCESAGAPRVLYRGWVSAYGSDAVPSVWFYSRGC